MSALKTIERSWVQLSAVEYKWAQMNTIKRNWIHLGARAVECNWIQTSEVLCIQTHSNTFEHNSVQFKLSADEFCWSNLDQCVSSRLHLSSCLLLSNRKWEKNHFLRVEKFLSVLLQFRFPVGFENNSFACWLPLLLPSRIEWAQHLQGKKGMLFFWITRTISLT